MTMSQVRVLMCCYSNNSILGTLGQRLLNLSNAIAAKSTGWLDLASACFKPRTTKAPKPLPIRDFVKWGWARRLVLQLCC